VVDVARFIVELLALADVAHERLEPQTVTVGRWIRARRHLHPYRVAVGAAQSQQVIVDESVGRQPLDERGAGLGIDETIAIERPDFGFGRLACVAEDQLEMRIGGNRRGAVGPDGADVHAFMDRFEQSREGRRASIHWWIINSRSWGPGDWGLASTTLLDSL